MIAPGVLAMKDPGSHSEVRGKGENRGKPPPGCAMGYYQILESLYALKTGKYPLLQNI
jgi:hypothetical protein